MPWRAASEAADPLAGQAFAQLKRQWRARATGRHRASLGATDGRIAPFLASPKNRAAAGAVPPTARCGPD